MKILFSPSEAKSPQSPLKKELKDAFFLQDLYPKRLEVIKKYQNFLRQATLNEVSKMIGIKEEQEVLSYKKQDIFNAPLQTAILRYTGVGYKYLDFSTLQENAQQVILDSTLIFSNLFGPIKADDYIPLYKLKQGENIGNFIPFKHYKEHFSKDLDEYLEDELIIDLRAGFYDKFYKPKHKSIIIKFLKNGKSVSHFAKAYRGLTARALALYNPKDEKELQDIPIPNLHIQEIQERKMLKIYIYEIIE